MDFHKDTSDQARAAYEPRMSLSKDQEIHMLRAELVTYKKMLIGIAEVIKYTRAIHIRGSDFKDGIDTIALLLELDKPE